MNSATVSRTKVDLSGLMKVLGENLYSTPTVALRELVQNAHDSCHRRRLESDEPFEPRVVVRTDVGQRTLSIEDNGAGLTREEIEKYLATVGAGYTRALRDSGAGEGLIGYFGLGFLSAFIVSERTEVHTCSYATPDQAWMFSSRAGDSYTIRVAEPRPVGTEVRLHLSHKFYELADLGTIRILLERYCCLLEFPVHCGPLGPVNGERPPWRDREQRSPLRRKKLALAFAQRFEPHFSPLFCMPLLPPDDGRTAPPCQGLLWIQDSATYGTSDNRNVWVFVRGMMVTDEDRELLPAWAGFAGAVIESDRLVPTASRESLQKDDHYRRVQEQVRDSLVAGLAAVARGERESWQRMLTRHNEALLGAALCDDRLFDLLANDLTVPTSQGDLTCPQLLARSGGKIHISQSDEGGFEELLFRALKVPVVRGIRYAALPFCRRFTERNRGSAVILGTGGGDREFFHPAAVGDDERRRLERWFAADDAQVVLTRFAPTYLPLMLVPDREIELKRRIESDEAKKSIATAALGLARMYSKSIDEAPAARLYVNLDCPAIQALHGAPDETRELALDLLRSFVSFSVEPEQKGKFMEVDAALQRFASSIDTLLRRGG